MVRYKQLSWSSACFDDDLIDEEAESAKEPKTTMPDAPDACMDCPEDNICDTCEHYVDPIKLEFPSLEIVPPHLPIHRKPPTSVPALATINQTGARS